MRFAELLGRSRLLLAAAVLLQWLTTLVVALRSDEVGFGAIELLHVALLGPIALLCAYRIGTRLGGVALGAWTLVVWVTTPWLLHVFTLASYDATVRDRVLPLGARPDDGARLRRRRRAARVGRAARRPRAS